MEGGFLNKWLAGISVGDKELEIVGLLPNNWLTSWKM